MDNTPMNEDFSKPPVERRPLLTEKTLRPLYLIDVIALVLTIAGGINWGLVGLFNFNLVHFLVGFPRAEAFPVLERIIYILVGISAVYSAIVTPAWIKHLQMSREREARAATI